MKADKELKERLAAIEHERWSDWQKWCHQILRENVFGVDSLEKVLERWDKQIATPYDKLSDQEKASDMEQVDRYWPLIQSLIDTRVREGKRDLVKKLLNNFEWPPTRKEELELVLEELKEGKQND